MLAYIYAFILSLSDACLGSSSRTYNARTNDNIPMSPSRLSELALMFELVLHAGDSKANRALLRY